LQAVNSASNASSKMLFFIYIWSDFRYVGGVYIVCPTAV